MICIIQRVGSASVKTDNYFEEINKGLLVLLGAEMGDCEKDCEVVVNKIVNLRIFGDDQEKMNLSVSDVSGEVLVVSQFTLLANCKKGRRPSFENAAEPKLGKELYSKFIEKLKHSNLKVKTGVFGAHMKVKLINDGPVTIILDSKDLV